MSLLTYCEAIAAKAAGKRVQYRYPHSGRDIDREWTSFHGAGGDDAEYRLADQETDEQADDCQGSALIKQAVTA